MDSEAARNMGDKDLEAKTKALYHVMQSIEVSAALVSLER